MTTCKSPKSFHSLLSATISEKPELFGLFVSLYHEQFPFRPLSVFEHHLQHFLEEDSLNSPTLTPQHMTVLFLYFEEEYIFAQKAFSACSDYSDQNFSTYDFLWLLEIVCRSNQQLSPNTAELEKIIIGLDVLTQALCGYLKISPSLLKRKQSGFLRHIRFLLLRIIQNDSEPSEQNNELYRFVQQAYPTAFAIAESLRIFIADVFSFELSDDEQAFLTLHIEKC